MATPVSLMVANASLGTVGQPTESPVSSTVPLPITGAFVQPNSVALASSSGNVANASAVATLAGAAGLTTYISGFEITGAGATAASVVTATITGLLGGTLTYVIAVPAGVTAPLPSLVVPFFPPLPSSSVNTNIVVTLSALGAGNTNAAVVAHGFRS